MATEERPLAELLAATVQFRESEFARVARLLHDEVGQVLSAVGLHLEALRLDLEPTVPDIAARTAEIQGILENAVELVRGLSYELNPAIVERAGLAFALDRLVGRFREGFAGSLRLLQEPTVHVSGKIGTAFYKIAEHALQNAVLHSEAPLVELLLRPTKAGIVMEVRDNGKGFDLEAVQSRSRGIGLIVMQHYATEADLNLELRSAPGAGTVVKASLRLPESGAARDIKRKGF